MADKKHHCDMNNQEKAAELYSCKGTFLYGSFVSTDLKKVAVYLEPFSESLIIVVNCEIIGFV